VFLIQRRFSHYSQFAEDVSIQRFFNKKFTGFFVDVGCFHPTKYNNTYLLYKKGWRGINVDIDSIKIEAFNLVRRGDVNIACAVGTELGTVEYYSSGFYALTSTIDKAFAGGKVGYIKKTAKCRSLTEIIGGTKFRGRTIDFLNVDTEGNDLKVLQSLDFEKYKPYLIAVESHLDLLESVMESKLFSFLVDRGYSMVGWCGLTLLMANKYLRKL
jgi:hypothetical protein